MLLVENWRDLFVAVHDVLDEVMACSLAGVLHDSLPSVILAAWTSLRISKTACIPFLSFSSHLMTSSETTASTNASPAATTTAVVAPAKLSQMNARAGNAAQQIKQERQRLRAEALAALQPSAGDLKTLLKLQGLDFIRPNVGGVALVWPPRTCDQMIRLDANGSALQPCQFLLLCSSPRFVNGHWEVLAVPSVSGGACAVFRVKRSYQYSCRSGRRAMVHYFRFRHDRAAGRGKRERAARAHRRRRALQRLLPRVRAR